MISVGVITEQVRTDYRFSLLTLSFSCSVLSFHIASPSVTPLSLHFTFVFWVFLVSSIAVSFITVSLLSWQLTLLHHFS